MPEEIMVDMIFENIGGTEILTVARQDTVNGQDVSFSYLKNLGVLAQSFNPTNMLSSGSEAYFQQFAIDIASRMPNLDYNASPQTADRTGVEIDADGNLVLTFDKMNSDELVEVEVSSSGIMYVVKQ